MYQLLIYGCDNPYGDGDDKQLFQRASNNLENLKEYIRQYQNALKEKHIIRLHYCLLEVDTAEGRVTVLDNAVASVPPKTRTVINPAAAPAVKKKITAKYVTSEQMLHATLLGSTAPSFFPLEEQQ